MNVSKKNSKPRTTWEITFQNLSYAKMLGQFIDMTFKIVIISNQQSLLSFIWRLMSEINEFASDNIIVIHWIGLIG